MLLCAITHCGFKQNQHTPCQVEFDKHEQCCFYMQVPRSPSLNRVFIWVIHNHSMPWTACLSAVWTVLHVENKPIMMVIVLAGRKIWSTSCSTDNCTIKIKKCVGLWKPFFKASVRFSLVTGHNRVDVREWVCIIQTAGSHYPGPLWCLIRKMEPP